MNKSEFIDFIADMHNMKKSAAEDMLNKVIDSIKDAMGKGEEVKITSFGTFQVIKREDRVGHHPYTGEKIQINAYVQPTFKVSKTLKEICNAGR